MSNKEYWLNRNVFVTGCTGFLGSYLVQELLNCGANVTGLIRDLVSESKLFTDGLNKRMNIARGSLEDIQILERILGEYEIQTVFHVAAQAIVGLQIGILSQHLRQILRELGTCWKLATKAQRFSKSLWPLAIRHMEIRKSFLMMRAYHYRENIPMMYRRVVPIY